MRTDNGSGHVAVITGASSEIGEATARALAADGYRVALLARRADRIRRHTGTPSRHAPTAALDDQQSRRGSGGTIALAGAR